MEPIKSLNYLSNDLGNQIILEINPKYIHILKNLSPRYELLKSQYEKKWYFNFDFSDRYTLVKSLRLEYYDLFDRLFENYQDSLSENLLNDLLRASSFIGNLNYFNWIVSVMNNKNIKPNYNLALESGLMNGRLEMVKYILKLMSDKNIVLDSKWILGTAVKSGHLEMVKFILELINNREIEFDYFTIDDGVKVALWNGNLEILKLILKGREPLFPPYYYEYMLMGAKDRGHLEMVKYISELINKLDY